jgi:hypothetical protein
MVGNQRGWINHGSVSASCLLRGPNLPGVPENRWIFAAMRPCQVASFATAADAEIRPVLRPQDKDLASVVWSRNPRQVQGFRGRSGSGRHRTILRMALLASVFSLNGRPHYLHSGWFLISVANLVVIVAMIAVFALAIVLPFPRERRRE